ncbi:MAG TPA: UbiA family prenyltransferase [Saprospiraceae bacterium]|nr:UbiA family prenyltransferase [Saprospiraceae bacterium]
MNYPLAFIRMLRLPNLLMVYLIQWVPYWYVLRPALLKAGGIPLLTERTVWLITSATVLTTLAGYILNDYYDRYNDAMNRPKLAFWGRILTPSFALILYAVVVGAAHWLAFLTDRTLKPHDHWPLWVFPGISFLLFLYAWVFKCTAVIGNLLVSFLCALAPLVMLLPEQRAIWLTSFIEPDTIHQAIALVWLYALFAFLANFLREQIKDLQDFPGDAACGCNTLAVLKGPRFAKKPAGMTALIFSLFLGVLLMFWQETKAPQWQLMAGIALLLIPAIGTTLILYFANGKKDFDRASMLLKVVMFSGIFLLLRSWPEDIVGAAQAYWAMLQQ